MGDESDGGEATVQQNNSTDDTNKNNSDASNSGKRRRVDKSPNREAQTSNKKTKRANAELVDLTEDDATSNNTSNNSNEDSHPCVITLEDSMISNNSRTPKASVSRRRPPVVIDVTVDDSDNDSPEPIHLKTPSHRLPRQAPQPPPPTPPEPLNVPKCPICIETYINVKKRGLKIVATRCGHVFCDFCLKMALSANGRKCPKCRKNVPRGVTGFIEIFDVC